MSSHRSTTPQITYIPLIIFASHCAHLIRPRETIRAPTASIGVYVPIGMETSSCCTLADSMIAIEACGAGATGASVLGGIIVVERRLVEGQLSIGVGVVIADVGAIEVCVEVCVGIKPKGGHYGYGWFCVWPALIVLDVVVIANVVGVSWF